MLNVYSVNVSWLMDEKLLHWEKRDVKELHKLVMHEVATSQFTAVPGQRVHTEFRHKHCNKRRIEQTLKRSYDDVSANTSSPVSLRSCELTFNFKKNCLFCGHIDNFDSKHQKGHKLIPVRSLDCQETIMLQCKSRNDKWSEKVLTRVGSVHDLPAADAVYHQICSSNFRTSVPLVFMLDVDDQPVRKQRGRKKDSFQEEAFLQIMADLKQADEEQTTINDLIDSMKVYLSDSNRLPYGFTYIKQRIKDYYGDDIVIAEINGMPNVVTFNSTVSKILSDFNRQSEKKDNMIEKMRLIEAAAKLIKSDIKSMVQSRDNYPSTDGMNAEQAKDFLPGSLRAFLRVLFPGTKSSIKVASVGQAIIQSTRPRVMLCPLQLGLGVQLHHHFVSRFLIDFLNSLGFCYSYAEVQRFERSAAVCQGTGITNLTCNDVVQYAADNVDHNTITIDGRNTFHGMGMIATVTPGTKSSYHVPRITVTTEDICSIGHVNIKYFTTGIEGIRSLSYHPLATPDADDPTSALDALWKAIYPECPRRPGWSGLMQMVQKGSHPGQSSVLYPPMIDLSPSDVSCVYSNLSYVSLHAKRHNVTPIITFDQPLWWKALQIRESEPEDSDIRSNVLRLGGFHTIMSFLGSIGHIMEGSGMQDVLEQIYASTAVIHMLSGKVVERAIRGHFLIDATLNAMLVAKAVNIDLSAINLSQEQDSNVQIIATEHQSLHGDEGSQEIHNKEGQPGTSETETDVPEQLLEELATIYDDVTAGKISLSEVQTSTKIQQFIHLMQCVKDGLLNFRNSQLWLQYMYMLDILRTVIKAERTGLWKLHLQATHSKLPYLAASGHNLYTKSVYLYLQDMMNLQDQHPEVYNHFLQGYHVVCRSNRFWAGLSVDLSIEQILMKSVKTTGGLTRGKGMSEVQRLVWLMSRPTCLEINNIMQEFSSVSYSTSDQHKEATQARIGRDLKDTKTLVYFLTERNPFNDDPALHNMVTGVTAEKRVNADHAKTIGTTIVKSMVGKCVVEHTFKKSSQIMTMASHKAVKISGEFINIDPQLLFQRLVTVGMRNEQLPEIFQYELSSYPSALFDMKHVMQPANKPVLADAMWSLLKQDAIGPSHGECVYVIDGGSLLHRIPWQKGSSYDSICQRYADYVLRHYGTAEVVFDGYGNGPSTKDNSHLKRNRDQMTEVHFIGSTKMNIKKDAFLSNKKNKQSFIMLLSRNKMVAK